MVLLLRRSVLTVTITSTNMKREIKFRYIIRHKATNNLISFDVTLADVEKYEGFWWMASMITGIPEDAGFKYEVVATLQYTGLKDKNGKEIYEADIIKCTDWKTGNSYFKEVVFEVSSDCVSEFHFGSIGWYKSELEVVGNIYENPELINNEPTDAVSDTTKAP